MSDNQPDPMARLIKAFSKLPGIGEKTATRLAFHILRAPASEAAALAESLTAVKEKLALCSICCMITEGDPCAICRSPERAGDAICVVEEVKDLYALEKAGGFRGRYHVLHGALSPLDGVGPDDIKTAELMARLRAGGVEEVILATNPDYEGDTTALYLQEKIAPLGIKVTRLARGIPVGGELEYTDPVTLGQALKGRRAMDE